MNLNVTDREGLQHVVQGRVGAVLMEVLRDADLGVEAVCGGCCACATCHVYVDTAVTGVSGEIEGELLQVSSHYDAARSRLSCQIPLGEEHDGLQVAIAPEE